MLCVCGFFQTPCTDQEQALELDGNCHHCMPSLLHAFVIAFLHLQNGKYNSPRENSLIISYPYAPKRPAKETKAKMGMNKSRSGSFVAGGKVT
mmetsp:Transcript_8871/g.24572  ORF Transcript_8871/g.24572 Transcript_8871/m.24572 type:complete len:93 (+) Transcript_8871:92-370(+)